MLLIDAVSADDLSSFFAGKVERIRSTMSSSAPPTIRPAPPGVAFIEFGHCHLTMLLDFPTSHPPRIHFRFPC